MRTKLYLFLCISLFSGLFLQAQEAAKNSLSVPVIEAGAGRDAKIVIDLENTEEVVAFQFNLTIPAGIVVSEKAAVLTDRKQDHVLSTKKVSATEYLFIAFSLANNPLNGKNGAVLELPVKIPDSYTIGQEFPINLTNVVVSSKDAVDIGSGHQNGILKIVEIAAPDLTVSGITFNDSEIQPEGTVSLSWSIDNIGVLDAEGGWSEQISLVSEKTGARYVLGTTSYDANLKKLESVSRMASFNMPKIVGMDGEVKAEVKVIPASTIIESPETKGNNTVISDKTALLQKLLYLVFNTNSIAENSTGLIRATLTHSGDRSVDYIYTLTSSPEGQVEIPAKLTIKKNNSSEYFYIKPIDNNVTDGDREVSVSVAGNEYTEVVETLTIIDDEFPVITLATSKESVTDGDEFTVTITSDIARDKDVTLNITADQQSRWTVPTQVVLTAGSTSATFKVTVKDTKRPEETVNGTITVRGEKYKAGSIQVQIKSSNVPAFSLEISPDVISESDGLYATYATIRRLDKPEVPVTLHLSADVANALILPSVIEFPANTNQKKFNIGVVDNAIVDGTRNVNVIVGIHLAGCSCTGGAGVAGEELFKTITILDNDGLALSVAANPSTVKAGVNDAAKITVKRNTVDVSAPVELRLKTDAPSIVEIPETATIPAGSESVDISINTKIDASKKGDQTVRIEAEAEEYSAGFGWILVSDQNKPDIIISAISADEQVTGGETVDVSISIKNQGFALMEKGSEVEYYISKSKSSLNATLLKTSVLDTDIPVDGTIEYAQQVQLPEQAGQFYLVVVVNSKKNIGELTYINNESYTAIELIPGYSATISVAKEIYTPGEIITLTGMVKGNQGISVANKNVEINISNGSHNRTYTVKSNTSGNFTYEFTPLQGESGHYSVSAGYPGTTTEPQVSFNIVGLDWVNKAQQVWDLYEDSTLDRELKFKNNTKITLSNVRIELPADADFTMQTSPINIAPGQTGTIAFKIIPNGVSTVQNYQELKLNIKSDEGAELTIPAWYYCFAHSAKLVAIPASINTTMIKDATRYIEFSIINSGKADAKNVKIAPPSVAWMKLKSPQTINIASFDTAKVVLELTPTVNEKVNVPISGDIAINVSNGSGIKLPFRIETVSESTGSLYVDVVDEYTYNTEKAPHVKGAKVVVRHPFSGNVVAEGETNEDGIFEAADIPEGYYTITVSADKHSGYQNNMVIDPGKVNRQKIFISYEAISYNWVVKPIEIEDEYEIELEVEFETNVPAPVVTMTIDNPELDLEVGQSRMDKITLTNHGLIAARDLSVHVESVQDYIITPLITEVDVLNAKSAITIPVLIERKESTRAVSVTCHTVVYTDYYYECDQATGVWKRISGGTYNVLHCHISGGTGIPGWWGGGVWGGGSGGWWGWSGPSIPGTGNGNNTGNATQPGITTHKVDCRNCDGVGVILDCASFVAGFFGPVGAGISFGISSVNIVRSSIVNGKAKGRDIALYAGGTTTAVVSLKTGSKAADIGGNILGGIGCFLSLKDWLDDECYKYFKSKPRTRDINGGLIGIDNSNMIKYSESTIEYLELTVQFIDELFKHGSWYEEENIDILWNLITKNCDDDGMLSDEVIAEIANEFRGSVVTRDEVIVYLNNWNKSLRAYMNDTSDFGYININNLMEIAKKIAALEDYAIKEGFVAKSTRASGEETSAFSEMFNAVYNEVVEFNEENTEDTKASACATVTVRFSQRLTMTREAFEGTLSIKNGHESKAMTEIGLDLLITNEDGVDCTHLFQVNKGSGIDGAGSIGAQGTGESTVIFIPTKEAAPTVAQSYSFGGTLSYLDPFSGEKVTQKLMPVTLEVNPSPDLVLHYFMQRDIFGDDPLTEDIEPMIPAELAVLIDNQGYGAAKNVKIESAQPRIIDNKLGLAIDFEIIGSNLNNEPKELGLLNVDFGSVDAHKTAVGQWWFTSTLLGHFVSYKLNVTHLSSYGNKNLSLIKSYHAHELIRSIKAYGNGHDNIADFLVNDIPDMNDTPDAIYYSNGDQNDVYTMNTSKSSNNISASKLSTTLTLTPSTRGWNYGSITDPGSNLFKLERVVRNTDNLELPIENFWQTHVTLRDGSDPLYENKLHFVDDFQTTSAGTSYTLYYTPIDTNVPKVVAFKNVTPGATTKQVEYIEVEFNKPIDFETFTTDDITLRYQGTNVATDEILIAQVNETTYLLTVKPLTITSGYYELTVQCAGINDLVGNSGTMGKSISWTQIMDELGINSFKTNQVKTQPVHSVEFFFNKLVAKEKLTNDMFKLNGKPIPNAIVEPKTEGNQLTYIISGLGEYNQDNGDYELSVNLPEIEATDGTTGLVVQTCKWYVDVKLPEVKFFVPQYQGSIHNQNVTDMQITLNKTIQEFLPEWVKLYKAGVDQNASFSISKIDSLNYLVSGLGAHTQTAGVYKMSVDQSKFVDFYNNNGVGKIDTTWVISFGKPSPVTNMKITPDRGASDNDNITSGNDIVLSLTTSQDARTVVVNAITPTGTKLVKEQYVDEAGTIVIPLNNAYSGRITFEAIVQDEYGNESNTSTIDAYIDVIDLGYTVSTIVTNESGCREVTGIRIEFTDNIVAGDLTNEAIVIKTNGLNMPTGNMVINQVSESVFELENLSDIANKGEISFALDMSYLHKKSSGLQGSGLRFENIGEIFDYSIQITGEILNAEIDKNYTYSTTENMRSYSWIVTGGTIVEDNGNTVTVKWSQTGTQSITLEYTTPENCRKSIILSVNVVNPTGVDGNDADNSSLTAYPNPNNGYFTLSIAIPGNNKFTLSIYDQSGKEVYRDTKLNVNNRTTKDIDLRPCAIGVYNIVIYNDDMRYITRFIVK